MVVVQMEKHLKTLQMINVVKFQISVVVVMVLQPEKMKMVIIAQLLINLIIVVKMLEISAAVKMVLLSNQMLKDQIVDAQKVNMDVVEMK